MYIKRNQAEKLFEQGNFAGAKEQVRLLPTILLPLNIVLGIVAIFLELCLGVKMFFYKIPFQKIYKESK